MPNRRETWRAFMGRFEPSADPRDAVERGFYVPRPGRSVAEQLASRFELKPSASHLLVGGVGSGKTTQLLVARDRLKASGDVCALYIDMSLGIEPNMATSEDLLCLVGLAMGRVLGEEDESCGDVRPVVEGFATDLKAPGRWPSDAEKRLASDLQRVHEALAAHYPHVVLLIDSLDRMSDLEGFTWIVESAVMRLRSIGIGVVLVGPITSLYGIQRSTLDRFDRVWHLPTVDAENDAEGRDFLLRVLRARDEDRMLTDAAAERLAALSGGVLRDLMALTQAAGEEAYVDGADQVEMSHVEIAADLFGRKHLFAIDSEQLKVLRRVRSSGTFVQTSEKDLALLSTRRVLEYEHTDGRPRFAVHPTIDPLLAQIAGAP